MNMIFADTLKKLREEKELSRKDLEKKCMLPVPR